MREIGFCVGRFSSSRNLLPRSHWSSLFSQSTWRLRDLSAKLCRKNTVAHFPISSPLSQGFPLLAQKYFVYLPKNIPPLTLKFFSSCSKIFAYSYSQRFPFLAQTYFVFLQKNISSLTKISSPFPPWNNNDNHARERPTAFPGEKSSCIGDQPRQYKHNAVVFSIKISWKLAPYFLWPLWRPFHSFPLSWF